MWNGRPARPKMTGGTPIPQTCGSYLILIPYRVFRGEGLMLSGLDAIAQMGLLRMLESVPHRQIDAWEFIVGDRQLF